MIAEPFLDKLPCGPLCYVILQPWQCKSEVKKCDQVKNGFNIVNRQHIRRHAILPHAGKHGISLEGKASSAAFKTNALRKPKVYQVIAPVLGIESNVVGLQVLVTKPHGVKKVERLNHVEPHLDHLELVAGPLTPDLGPLHIVDPLLIKVFSAVSCQKFSSFLSYTEGKTLEDWKTRPTRYWIIQPVFLHLQHCELNFCQYFQFSFERLEVECQINLLQNRRSLVLHGAACDHICHLVLFEPFCHGKAKVKAILWCKVLLIVRKHFNNDLTLI